MNLITKIIIIILVIGFIGFAALQLVPVDRSNPPVVSEPQWDSPQTRALAERACFDCHSNQTKWPWYAYVAPVSWLVAHDVEEGRANMNLSEWTPGEQNETGRVIKRGIMPPSQYLMMHPEARLTDAEKQALIDGLAASLK
jgi:cytochrome c551/c552